MEHIQKQKGLPTGIDKKSWLYQDINTEKSENVKQDIPSSNNFKNEIWVGQTKENEAAEWLMKAKNDRILGRNILR